MDNSQNQPLPPGVGTWPPPPSNHPSQFQPSPHSYPRPYDTRPNYGNNYYTASLFSAAQPNTPFPPAQSMILGATTDAGNGQSDLKGHQTAHEATNHNGSAANIESAVQEAVLHEQVFLSSRGSRLYLQLCCCFSVLLMVVIYDN